MSTQDTSKPRIQLRKLVLNRESMTTLTEREAEAAKGGLAATTTTSATRRSTIMCSSTGNCCITLF